MKKTPLLLADFLMIREYLNEKSYDKLMEEALFWWGEIQNGGYTPSRTAHYDASILDLCAKLDQQHTGLDWDSDDHQYQSVASCVQMIWDTMNYQNEYIIQPLGKNQHKTPLF